MSPSQAGHRLSNDVRADTQLNSSNHQDGTAHIIIPFKLASMSHKQQPMTVPPVHEDDALHCSPWQSPSPPHAAHPAYCAMDSTLTDEIRPSPHQPMFNARQPVPALPHVSESLASREYGSKMLAVAPHAPPGLRERKQWSVQDFELRKLLYNGNISLVYHAVDRKTGISVALKLYKRSKLNELERHQVAREIRLHIRLSDESVIHLYAAWKDQQYVYMALEWAPGGDLYSFLKRHGGYLSEELAVPLVIEPFIYGVNALHQQGLIHRDIKPENILINRSCQIKIADFGLSIDSKMEVANTRLGTVDYLAPEILECPIKQHPNDHKENPSVGYSSRVDCWSIGVLCYEVLTGQLPFASPTVQQTLQAIRSKPVVPPAFLSKDAASFILTALVRDPKQRPSCEQLLQHPWIAKYSRRNAAVLSGPVTSKVYRSKSDATSASSKA